jgi:hypothetical protein
MLQRRRKQPKELALFISDLYVAEAKECPSGLQQQNLYLSMISMLKSRRKDSAVFIYLYLISMLQRRWKAPAVFSYSASNYLWSLYASESA